MKRSSFSEYVTGQVWTPYSSYQHSPNKDYCRASVPDGGRSVGMHQCTRKAVVELEGFGFCIQHAHELKIKYGIRDTENETVIYFAKFSSEGNHSICKVYIAKRSDKTITVTKTEDIVGSIYLSLGVNRLDSSYMRVYKIFDEEKDAWLYLQERSVQQHQDYTQRLDKSIENMRILNELISNEVWNRH